MNAALCPVQNHQEQKITAICFNKECKEGRLCCLMCKGEFHSAHPENLIEIDLFYDYSSQESNKAVEYPDSYTFGQCQLIQQFEGLLNQINGFQQLIIEQIEKLKKSSLQEYLKQQPDAQQGTQIWNQYFEQMLQYFEVQDQLLTKKDQKQGELNESEKNSVIIINQTKDGLKQIEKSFLDYFQPKQLKFQSKPQLLEGHQGSVYGVSISSDGSMIASGSKDKTVKLWDVGTKQLIQTFQYNEEIYEGVAFSYNNLFLAYGGFGDYSIMLQDLKQNTLYATLMGHKSYISTICSSHDSQLLFSGGGDKKLIVWDINQKTKIHNFDVDSIIITIVPSVDNILISCLSDKSINIWDYSTKTQLIHEKNPHNGYGWGLCSSKDSQMFISSGYDGLIKIWKLSDIGNNQKSLKLNKQIKAADGKSIYKVILTPDEQYIISICNPETKVMIHDIETGNLIQELLYGDGIGNGVNGYVSISNDMNILVCGGEDKMVKIWTRE